MDPLDTVQRHPRLGSLARNPREALRLQRFASDLAHWLHGAPRDQLGALARVVTLVAQRELRDARRLCEGRPLLAVEAAARATEALWPLLRGPLEPEAGEEEDDAPPPGDGEGEGGDAAEDGDEDGGAGMGGGAGLALPDPDAPPSEGGGGSTPAEGSEAGEPGDEAGEGDPLDVLAALADMDTLADPELDALAERLRERMEDGATDVEAEAGDLLGEVGEVAENAAMETDRAARHLERFLPGIGWSGAPGALERTLLEQLDGLTALLANLDQLQHLADALGRLEDPTTERGTLQGGREEVVGVTMGGEVANALPSELALLADEDTEDLFYQRLIEHRLVSLELTGQGDHGAADGDRKGPVIACIDTSGSMEGPPELAAKALVLAVCRRVLPRNRTVHLILFGGAGERTEIRLRRGRGGLEALLGFLLAGFRSGTDFDGPLLRAMDLLEEDELHRADVLVVTDGLCRATPAVIERVTTVRDAMGARIWSVVLGRADPRGVEPFSDTVLVLDPSAAASATGLLKSL
jgi:uncharacterized protein with von Willebrand factor type A (vWA) domain